MESQSQRRKERSEALPSLNAEIDALNLARDTAAVSKLGVHSHLPAPPSTQSGLVLLQSMQMDRWMTNVGFSDHEVGFVDLGLSCAGICQDLKRGMNGRGSISLANTFLMRLRNRRRGLCTYITTRRFTTLSIAELRLGSGVTS